MYTKRLRYGPDIYMEDILSQSQIDALLKQILEPSQSADQSKTNIWNCQKCKKQFDSLKTDDERNEFIFGKHAIIKNNDGITTLGIFANDGRMVYRGAASKGVTIICLKCGYREIMIAKSSLTK